MAAETSRRVEENADCAWGSEQVKCGKRTSHGEPTPASKAFLARGETTSTLCTLLLRPRSLGVSTRCLAPRPWRHARRRWANPNSLRRRPRAEALPLQAISLGPKRLNRGELLFAFVVRYNEEAKKNGAQPNLNLPTPPTRNLLGCR